MHVPLFFGQRKILLHSLSEKTPVLVLYVRPWYSTYCPVCVSFSGLPSPHDPGTCRATPLVSSFVSPQFVNHVCNSQQLSNKALLTGHLAFRQDHTHAHARHFPEDSMAKSSADSACADVSSKGRQDSRWCRCAGAPDDEAPGREGGGPEAFFPRCWDVRDGGFTSLLKAFVVSAATALLRRAVEADVRYFHRCC